MPSPINIEIAFARCIKAAGGVVLEEHLPASPAFENEDYLFETERVVVELKTLSEDTIGSAQFISQVSVLFRKWVLEGKVPSHPEGRHVFQHEIFPKIVRVSCFNCYVRGC